MSHLDALRAIVAHASDLNPFTREVDSDLDLEAGMDGHLARLLQSARDLDREATHHRQHIEEVSMPAHTLAASVVHTDGNVTIHAPTGSAWTQEELQSLIGGGCIEVVAIPGDGTWCAICDEDGLEKGLEHNRPASWDARQRLVGTVAFLTYDALGFE